MSSKVEARYTDYLKETFDVMRKMGLLLVSTDAAGKPNAMTIGWGTIGIIWGKPIFIVLVRPSRYTHGLMEQTEDFTVNVPSADLADVVAFCGSASGRDHDKFSEKGLVAVPGKKVKSPVIEQCVIHYECNVVYQTDLNLDRLPKKILSEYYPARDLHTFYFGEILTAYGEKDVEKRILD